MADAGKDMSAEIAHRKRQGGYQPAFLCVKTGYIYREKSTEEKYMSEIKYKTPEIRKSTIKSFAD